MSAPARNTPGVRTLVFWALLAGVPAVFVAVRSLDPFGDRGMANVIGTAVALLLFLVWLGWFLCARRFALRVRFSVLATILMVTGAAAVTLRVRGFHGDMVPEVQWRFGASSTSDAAAEAALAGAVDLERTSAEDFPGFLGPTRDGRVARVAIATDWRAHPPRLLWRGPIGPGWSGFAVVNGWAVTIEQGDAGEVTSARDLRTGAVAWRRVSPGHVRHALGGDGPRSTPAIAAGRVVTLGGEGRLACLDGHTGAVVWEHDLSAEFGLDAAGEFQEVGYGRSNSPLVHEGRVIVPAGGAPGNGQAGLAAFDLASGALLWKSDPRAISYSSPAAATLLDVPQILIVNEGTLSAHDPASGKLLWEHPWPGESSGDANVSQALPVPPDRVFVSKGYGGGGLLLRLARDGEALRVEELWHDSRLLRTKFTNVVLHEGHLYGLDDGVLECVELASGTRAWKEGRFGHGQLLLAGAHLVVVSEEGEVLLVEARPDRAASVLASFQGLEGKCWGTPALSGAVLLLRNAEECAAWELPLDSL